MPTTQVLLLSQWPSTDDGAVSQTRGSTLAADGRVYMPTANYLWVLKAGKTLEVLDRISLGSRICVSRVVATEDAVLGDRWRLALDSRAREVAVASLPATGNKARIALPPRPRPGATSQVKAPC